MKKQMSLSLVVNIGIGVFFSAVAATVVFLINSNMRAQALVEAESKAKILLDRTIATHNYFSDHLKPHVFKIMEQSQPAGYFDPVWMSSTYANRMIDADFCNMNQGFYYFKNCAINARSPENEAYDYEKAFIQKLNIDPGLLYRSYVKDINGQPYFIVLRRGETMRQACAACHTTPDLAPTGLINIYGPDRSFNRRLDEVISAQSVRIPLAAAYANADRVTWQLSVTFLLLLTGLFSIQYLLQRKLVFSPLKKLEQRADEIARNEEQVGSTIPIPYGKELRGVVHAFNTMSKALRYQIDHLEEKVVQRTNALTETNKQLSEEISERRKAELEVKTLSGLLPICSWCKKIRDDKGYWEKIESYISRHSAAQFTHGICEECLQEHYPQFSKLVSEKDSDKPDSVS